jgi:lactate permease
MTWAQQYDPFGNVWLSTLVACLPVVGLLGLIASGWVRIHWAAFIGLGLALGVAGWGYAMPASAMVGATIYGAAYGLFPIGWIVLNVLFFYHLTVRTGLFEILRDSLSRVAPDPRVQLILIAFSLGAFIEGVAGIRHPGGHHRGDPHPASGSSRCRRPSWPSSPTPRRSPSDPWAFPSPP